MRTYATRDREMPAADTMGARGGELAERLQQRGEVQQQFAASALLHGGAPVQRMSRERFHQIRGLGNEERGALLADLQNDDPNEYASYQLWQTLLPFSGRGTIVREGTGYGMRDEAGAAVYPFNAQAYRWLGPGLVGLGTDYRLNARGEATADGPPQIALNHIESISNPMTYGMFAQSAATNADAAGLVAAGHMVATREDRNVWTHMQDIKTGVLTSRRDTSGAIATRALAEVRGNVSTFYKITTALRQKYQDPLAAKGHTITVYRAIRTGQAPAADVLPSSTSLSLAKVQEWAGADNAADYVILEITVPITHRMLMMAYPDAYPGIRYPNPINQDQQEVTLAPSSYTVGATRNEDGWTIVSVQAQELSEEGVMAQLAGGEEEEEEEENYE
jgi:hypothetical protein